MKSSKKGQIYSLELPLESSSLIVPSASIAEVVSINQARPVPFSPPWMIGVFGWRMLAVPLVSFESLILDVPASPLTSRSKVVVFYPLSERCAWEFFAVPVISEPRAHGIDHAATTVAADDELPDSPYVAAGIKVDSRLMYIPDLEFLRKKFYP